MTTEDAARRDQYLSFHLAGSEYAVGILQVREILQYEPLTRVPSLPPSIRGVINLRGAVVPVVDVAVKFGLAETRVTKQACILIVEATLAGTRAVVGIMADAVREVLELGPDEIEPPPSVGAGARADFLVGMGRAGGGFVLLLDLARVISAREEELARPRCSTRDVRDEELSAAARPPPPTAEGVAPA